MTQLTTLQVCYNELSILDDADLFAPLTQLKTLWLMSNKLTFLHPRLFVALSQLTFIELKDNHLSVLDANIFQSLTSLHGARICIMDSTISL
jgi:hypothetical protein